MADDLSGQEWDELASLIAAAPPERMINALDHVRVIGVNPNQVKSRRPAYITLRTIGADEWLSYIDSISPNAAFDRALLDELRRLSVH